MNESRPFQYVIIIFIFSGAEWVHVSEWLKKALACIIMYFPADFLTHIIMWSAEHRVVTAI